MSQPYPYTHCTTADAAELSLPTLSKAEYLVVDCEGRDLGTRFGALSTISVGTPRPSETFVYDAVLLDCSALMKVMDLLSNPELLKVMWDGRMDFSEIYHTYQKRIENVLDMQLAEVMSRTRQRQMEADRQRRIKAYLRPSLVFPWKDDYEGIHVVVGMKRCLDEQGLASSSGKDPVVMRIHRQHQSDVWMERPLPKNLLNYAAKDVHLIRLIYVRFRGNGYLSPNNTLLTQSKRYVSMHADLTLKPLKEDHFRSSPVLPLDVLDGPIGEYRRECDACHRKLSMPCFKQQGGKHDMMCKACHVVAIKYEKGRAERDE